MFNLKINSKNRQSILDVWICEDSKRMRIGDSEIMLRDPAEVYVVVGSEDSIKIRYHENALTSLIYDAVQIGGLENIETCPEVDTSGEFYTLRLIFPKNTRFVL